MWESRYGSCWVLQTVKSMELLLMFFCAKSLKHTESALICGGSIPGFCFHITVKVREGREKLHVDKAKNK